MTRTLFPDNAALMSPRTIKFVQAMVREDFDYDDWLAEVREEEAQAKRAEATGTSGELALSAISKPMRTPDRQHGRPNPPLPLIRKTIRVPRRLLRPYRQAQSRTPEARLRRWLEKVHRAWGDFQSSRSRDAVYGYLEAVFAIVMHYKVQRRINRLLRHAFEFANLPFDKNADPFAAIIRCASGNNVDSKTISKWARALRFVARYKNLTRSLGNS
jgi:hypothetical protein